MVSPRCYLRNVWEGYEALIPIPWALCVPTLTVMLGTELHTPEPRANGPTQSRTSQKLTPALRPLLGLPDIEEWLGGQFVSWPK